MGDHSETLQIEFDPELITYEKLLSLFWKAHDPTWSSQSRQYRAALFYHGKSRRGLRWNPERGSRQGMAGKSARMFFPFRTFTGPRTTTRNTICRQDRILMGDFRAIYPEVRAFTDSTAAARVNGYLAGYGSRTALQHDLDLLRLSPEGRKRLLDSVSPG